MPWPIEFLIRQGFPTRHLGPLRYTPQNKEKENKKLLTTALFLFVILPVFRLTVLEFLGWCGDPWISSHQVLICYP